MALRYGSTHHTSIPTMPSAPRLPGEPIHWPGGFVATPEPRAPRRITQLCGSGEGLFALCNDGTVWQLLGGVWLPEPGIPQRQLGGCHE